MAFKTKLIYIFPSFVQFVGIMKTFALLNVKPKRVREKAEKCFLNNEKGFHYHLNTSFYECFGRKEQQNNKNFP